MKKKPVDKRWLWGGGALLCIVLLACANYLAGALLFLSYKENPAQASFATIGEAIATAPNALAVKRIKFSIAGSVLLCFLLPFALLMHLRNKPRGHDLYGNSSFADMDDIKREKLDAEVGLVLGKFKKKLLRLSGYEFVLLAAPTRTGKGVGFCIPNLLQFQGSAVVLDIKGENYNLSSEFRRRYMGNEIVYFNPFSENSRRWNPLSYVSTDPSYRANDLLGIAAIIYPLNEKEPFWANAARNLFLGLALLVLETPALPKTMGEILRQGSGKGSSIEDYLAHVLAVSAAGATPLSAGCVDALNRFLGSGEDSLKGILATFSATLTPFANDVIDKATSGDDFDLRDVRRKKMTIYLTIPAAEMQQAAFIVNLFFSQLIKENVKELPEHNPALKHQCLLLLDEFTAMGKVDIIAKGVGFMAGYNMRLAIIIQDKSQLDAVYGKEDAHNIVSNMGAVIYFTPSQVDEAEQYSKMIGNNTVLSDSRQRSKGQLFGLKSSSGDSVTESYQSRAVMLPQELLSMSKDAQLILRPGIPVIKADKIRYFSDPYFKERYNAVPMHEVTIGDERRRVPVPTRLPKGEWESYRASLAGSGYYRTLAAPAAPGAPASDAGPAAAAPASAPSAAAVSLVKGGAPEAAHADYVLPALPASHTPYCALHALLARPQLPPPPSSRTAVAYADSMVRYWLLAHAAGGIDDDEWLPVVDLSAGNGEFAWQMMHALLERLATTSVPLPPFRYIACVQDAQQQGMLDAHPYFAAARDEGHFLVTTLESWMGSEDGACAGNPCVTVAHGLMATLPQSMLGVRDGELFGIASKVTDAPAPHARQLRLDHQWTALPEHALSASEAALAGAYRRDLAEGTFLLPGGALTLLDQLRRLTAGRFLFLAADRAIHDERDIRLGAYRLSAELNLPPPTLPTNYHALELHLQTFGAEVWQQSVLDSDLCCMAALCGEAPGSLAELLPPVVSAHGGGARRGAGLARQQGLTLDECLSLVQAESHDSRLLAALFPTLRSADWNLTGAALERWQQALARCWQLYLPVPERVDFYMRMATLARQAGYPGLARGALKTGMTYFGETVDDLCQIADCELATGDTQAARTLLQRALQLRPQHAEASRLMAEATRRLDSEKSLPWFRAARDATAELRLEPLSLHHAEQLHCQFRDPRIAQLSMLPTLDSVQQAGAWIAAECASPGVMGCAVMHESWGLVGYIGAQRHDGAAYLTGWTGTDHQQRGYGRIALESLIGMLATLGVHDCFAASTQTNEAARRTLAAAGFAQLDAIPKSPYESLRFAHLQLGEQGNDAHRQLDALCAVLAIPVEFEPVPTAHSSNSLKRSR